MTGIFESITRVAIEEILMSYTRKSKFGYILPEESLSELSDEIVNLVVTSRNLKEAGDKLLAQGVNPGRNQNQSSKF